MARRTKEVQDGGAPPVDADAPDAEAAPDPDGGPAPELDAGPPPDFEPETPRSELALTVRREITPKLGSYESWPLVYETPGGAWLLAYTSGSTHLPTSESRSIVQRSTDQG